LKKVEMLKLRAFHWQGHEARVTCFDAWHYTVKNNVFGAMLRSWRYITVVKLPGGSSSPPEVSQSDV
jgi:hypothetical protein